MANVRLTVGGRNFVVACAPGEEAHVSALGKMIDTKIMDTQDAATLSEPRVLLYAALMLADELHDARKECAAPAPPPAVREEPGISQEIVSHLDAIAVKLENLAARLEGQADNA